MEAQKIYHGAPLSALESILKHGIVPRPANHPGSWPGETSIEGFVYLTVSQAIYYATAPTREPLAVIFELDLDEIPVPLRYPDEDYLAQEAWMGNEHYKDPNWSLDIRVQQSRWCASLEKMGNIAVEGAILPCKIKRFAILDNDPDIWGGWYERRTDRLITEYPAREEILRESLSYLFDRSPNVRRMSRAEFGRLHPDTDDDELDFYWLTARATQVAKNKRRLSEASNRSHTSNSPLSLSGGYSMSASR